MRHPVREILGQKKSQRVRRGVARRLIVEASVARGVAIGENRPQTGQNIIVIDILAVDGVVTAVIRVILAGLQAVRDFAGCRDPVGGRLEIDPDAAGVVGLEVRVHGGAGYDRRVRKGGQRKCCAEHERNAEQHSDASAPFDFENGQSASFKDGLGKREISGRHHLLSPADCPLLWRSCGRGNRDTRRTCRTGPCGTVGASGSFGTPGTARLCRCRSGRRRASRA